MKEKSEEGVEPKKPAAKGLSKAPSMNIGDVMAAMRASQGILGKALESVTLGGVTMSAEAYNTFRANGILEPPSPSMTQLQREIGRLKADAERQLVSGQATKAELESVIANLQRTQELAFLLERVTKQAHPAIHADGPLKERFFSKDTCEAFVLSIDIRRSTELMLKAKSPDLFAEFMTSLCADLSQLVKEGLGVVDKFTGDGLLAFFPKFFSGDDFAFRCVATAQDAHKIFESKFKQHRGSFSTVLLDVGLGIGIDFGSVRLVQVAGGLTVVGVPVVYACRMGSAPAGKTYLNQHAYEELASRASSHCLIKEVALEIKHEGKILAYDVELTSKQFVPTLPEWAQAAAETE